jgi:hypothetical protein
MVARAGYAAAFSNSPGVNFWGDQLFLKRIEVQDSATALGLACRLAVL